MGETKIEIKERREIEMRKTRKSEMRERRDIEAMEGRKCGNGRCRFIIIERRGRKEGKTEDADDKKKKS